MTMMPSRKPKGIDVEALKRQAAGRWPELLSTLGGVSADILDGKNHPCPKCGGTDRFRYDRPGGNGSCSATSASTTTTATASRR